VSDYDAAHRILSITKARVMGLDKDMTKTGADRRIELCPRAVAIIERQLRLRRRLMGPGLPEHEQLFVTDTGEPIRRLWYPYARWARTLRRLAIRYRKPYAARHTSVSWDLMIGRNLLSVARQHGHSAATMLSVYAAWIEGQQRNRCRCNSGGNEQDPTQTVWLAGRARHPDTRSGTPTANRAADHPAAVPPRRGRQ